MGWSIGYDSTWHRDIGYGVPATCDHPGCGTEIDRGLAFVCCDAQPYGGGRGCGLYFCSAHRHVTEDHYNLCARCLRGNPPFGPTPDTPEWINHKLTDPSWAAWRDENPAEITAMTKQPDKGEEPKPCSNCRGSGYVSVDYASYPCPKCTDKPKEQQ